MPHVVQRAFVVGVCGLTTLVACGDDGNTEKMDAPGPCWPLPSTPGGEVELGTGDIAWEPMPDTLTIVKNGSQSDAFLQIHSRIRGMPPGNPQDPFDPTNPRTKIGAVVEEINLVLGAGVVCPASIGYVPAPGVDGAYDLQHSLRAGFGTFPPSDANGMHVRITVEVVGSNKLYAKAEKLVLLDIPPTPVDAGVDAPPDAQ
ncbi:MAG TPA: hypothetical protein VFQ53_40750 [Kofleriaceae bacterium]|nr:hypothetical protein [Kofleriaceae bacterium]